MRSVQRKETVPATHDDSEYEGKVAQLVKKDSGTIDNHIIFSAVFRVILLSITHHNNSKKFAVIVE